MESVPLGLAFTAGMLSIANPCALGMIPAYVALRAQTAGARPLRIVVLTGVGGLVGGFVGVFVAVALLLSLFGRVLLQSVPFVASAIGVALLVLGAATLLGRRIHIALPAVEVRGGPDTLAAQALFGASYGLASLGCALPIFLAFAAMALGARDPLALVATVATFAAGAAVTLLALVLVGTAAHDASRRLPGGALATRYGSGVLLVVAGLYLLYVQLGWLIGYPLGFPVVTLPL